MSSLAKQIIIGAILIVLAGIGLLVYAYRTHEDAAQSTPSQGSNPYGTIKIPPQQ